MAGAEASAEASEAAAVAAVVPVAREENEPGGEVLTRAGVAAEAAVAARKRAGADKVLALPGKLQPYMKIF